MNVNSTASAKISAQIKTVAIFVMLAATAVSVFAALPKAAEADSGYDYYTYTPSYDSGYDYYSYTPSYDYYSYTSDTYDYYTYTPTYDYYSYTDYPYTDYSYTDYSYTDYPYTDYSYTDYSYTDYPSYSYDDYSYYTPQPIYDYQEQYYVYDDYDYSWTTPSRPSYDEPKCVLIVEDKTLTEGQSTTLTWETEDVDHATLSGFGSVDEHGGSKRISPTRTTTYNLSVEGRGGSDDCYITVTVDEKEEEEDLRCELSVSDKTIEEDEEVTLRWTTEGADSVHINQGIGNVSRSGSERVSPNRTTTYTLTAEDDHGNEEDCTVTVRVEEEDEDDLWCELDASDRSIEEGDYTTLRWDTRGDVDEARINQGVGSVDEDGGSERVRPDRDTRYVLTVENNDGDEEDCSVTIDVEDGLAPPPDVPLVYLSQLPYTGVEDSMAYWLLLITGSGLLGYMFFFRALPFAVARVKMFKSDDVVTPTEAGEGEVTVPQNVTRQDVRAFVSALAEGDEASAREFARAHGAVLFAETAVVLDDVVRARDTGGASDPTIASMTQGWNTEKFATLIEAFADANDTDAAVTEAITA